MQKNEQTAEPPWLETPASSSVSGSAPGSSTAVRKPEEHALDAGIWGWLTSSRHRTLFHPTAGLWVLGLDWLLFSGNAVTLGWATLLVMVIGFALGSAGTFFCQRHYARTNLGKGMALGLFGGMIVGAPLPVAGTFAGTIIIGLSGLTALMDRLPFRRS